MIRDFSFPDHAGPRCYHRNTYPSLIQEALAVAVTASEGCGAAEPFRIRTCVPCRTVITDAHLLQAVYKPADLVIEV